MKIIKDEKVYCVTKLLAFNKYGVDEYDIEFDDEHGNYRHWQSWSDGGRLVKDDLTDLEVNADYEIQSRVMINDKECYVIGYDPKNDTSPYVTWFGSKRQDGWTYYWGHYCDTLQSALNDLGDRISNKRYEFDKPTQVIFTLGDSKVTKSGIAYRDEVIDVFGETFSLKNPYQSVKIRKRLNWDYLDGFVGGDEIWTDESEDE